MKEQNTGEYDALVDEVEKLRAERDEWQTRAEQYETAWVNENAANCELTDAIAKLRAEREELRKALQQIAGWFPGMTYGGRVFDAQEIARAALAEKGE